MMYTVLAVLAVLAIGAFFLRNIPVIAIPVGLLLMAPFALGILNQYFRSRDHSVGAVLVPLILFVLFLAALIGAPLFVAGIRRLTPERRRKTLMAIAIAIFFPAGIAFQWWSHTNIERVTRSAEQIAGNEPYCIDVPSGRNRKQATSSSQFSGYRMRGHFSLGRYYGPHAILAVGAGDSPAVYHWSHSRRTFVEFHGTVPVYCQPRPRFATTFATSTPPATRQPIRIAGASLLVPDRYRGEIDGVSLVFYAAPPDFDDVPEEASEQARRSRIEVSLVDHDRTGMSLYKNSKHSLVEDTGVEHGLQAQTTWSIEPDGRKGRSPPILQYFNSSNENELATVIRCHDNGRGQCSHAFRKGTWTYWFHHSHADLQHWKRMQDELVELMHSFVQAPAL
jgi:hypothetical protein